MPMSGDKTLDVILQRAKRHGWKDTGKLNDNCNGYYAENSKLIVDKFTFSFSRHDTGCSVAVNIITDEGLYEIVKATYWYSSQYLFNKETWNYGAWDKAFKEAVQQLEDFVYFCEQKEYEKFKLSQQEKLENERLQKLCVENMFK